MLFSEMLYLITMLAFCSYAAVILFNKKDSIFKTLDIITLSNLNWVSYSIFMLIQPLYQYLKHTRSYLVGLFVLSFLMFICGKLGAYYLIKRRGLIGVKLYWRIEGIFLGLIIVFNLMYTLGLSIMAVSSMGFAGFALLVAFKLYYERQHDMSHVYGYLIIGSLLILVANYIYKDFWEEGMFVLIQMASLFLTLTGVFFFFFEFYSFEIETQKKDLNLLSDELINAQDEINKLAYYHPVTEYPNQAMLLKDWTLEKEMTLFNSFAIIEISNWHQIEHRFESLSREKILKVILDEINLQCCFDKVYHIRDNEFAVLSEQHSDALNYLMKSCFNSCINNVVEARWQCSMDLHAGITAIGNDHINEVIKKANIARRIAIKENELTKVYIPELKTMIEEEMIFESKLRQAVKDASWTVFYQPKIKVEDESVCGAEALIRWPQEKSQYGSPAYFIPMAEKIGLINDIGDFVISEVFQYAHRFEHLKDTGFEFSINLSPLQLYDERFVDRVKWKMNEYNVDPSWFVFEITESSEIDDYHNVIKKLESLKELGFKVSLDDFGVGYSNLHNIPELPIDEIKFDKLITDRLTSTYEYRLVMENFLNLAQKLNLRTVIEGIESEEQTLIIKKMGVDQCQGYLYSKPLDSQMFYKYVNAHRKAS